MFGWESKAIGMLTPTLFLWGDGVVGQWGESVDAPSSASRRVEWGSGEMGMGNSPAPTPLEEWGLGAMGEVANNH
ncbi:hypothetical protein [Fischerella sp. JS2]|uniref:hypothetical protein n=1 Tax=Fischerella sp. JS2 TaxID=2597771 RepID=UPI0028ED8238|nr:hypothetical protein [Fischerella sp. JS2]